MINGHLTTTARIVRAYVDTGFNVCTLTHLVCALNYNGVGYKCIAEVIKNDHIHINELISEHDFEIKRLKNLSGHTN